MGGAARTRASPALPQPDSLAGPTTTVFMTGLHHRTSGCAPAVSPGPGRGGTQQVLGRCLWGE